MDDEAKMIKVAGAEAGLAPHHDATLSSPPCL